MKLTIFAILLLLVENVCSRGEIIVDSGTHDLIVFKTLVFIFGTMVIFGTLIVLGTLSLYSTMLLFPFIMGWLLISWFFAIFKSYDFKNNALIPVLHEDEPEYFTFMTRFIPMLFYTPPFSIYYISRGIGISFNNVMIEPFTEYIG